MSIFSEAVNAFRSTASRAGKFYESTAAVRGRALSATAAYAAKHPARTVAAATVVGSGIGLGLAPKGHKSWGMLGGPAGGIAARGIYRGRR